MKHEISLMQSHLNKMNRAFQVVLTLVTLVELIMMIRGFVYFNLERLKHRLYLYSYIFLFATSLVTLIFFTLCNMREQHRKKISIVTYIYAFCLIAWSALVTCIDCYADGDSGIMVYVMTCTAVGILTLIKPQIFLAYLGVSSAVVLILTAFARNWTPYSSGFYLNFMIFMATAAFINAHNYRLSKREHEANQKLETLSYTDQLTGVYNRRSLSIQAQTYIEKNTSFTFVLLDIDNFKDVNDTYGHPKGDACLITLAKKLTEHFGKNVYRFGGDEFALLSNMNTEAVCAHLDAVNQELNIAEKTLPFQISSGIYAASGKDAAEQIFSRADQALYEAKLKGKARWSLYQNQK